jgi:hypothetical protein
MFFEPLPAQEESARPPKPGLPAWCAPPAEEMGAILVSRLKLAHSVNVAIIVPTIQVFSTGCLINVDIAMRRHTLSPDGFEALQRSMFFPLITTPEVGQLPDQLLRFGVRFADGTKATTVGQRFGRRSLPQDPPPGPQLSLLLPGVSARSDDEDSSVTTMGLWLWPSPPRDTFEFAVEWPAGGIELSIVRLDGAAIVDAAHQVIPYWPESP